VAAGGAAPDGSIGIVDEHAVKAVFNTTSHHTIPQCDLRAYVRNAPNNAFNERDRSGFLAGGNQKITDKDDLNIAGLMPEGEGRRRHPPFRRHVRHGVR